MISFRKQSLLLTYFIVALTFSLLIYYSPTVSAADLSQSEINAVNDLYEFQRTTISVLAKGTSGVVSGADVNISATLGTFVDSGKTWIELTTNSSGLVSTVFKAPNNENESATIEITITALITSESDTIQLQQNITIHPIDFSSSTINFTPNNIYEDHNSTVTIVAKGPYGIIEGATVDFSCTGGQFSSGTGTDTATTNSNGVATTQWQAPLIAGSTSVEYNISATLSYTGETLTFFLSANITVYPIDFNSSTLVLSQQQVNGGSSIDVTVTAAGQIGPVSNALVTLSALDGQFKNGLTTIDGQTDSSGTLVKTWTAPDVSSDINITISAHITYPNVAIIKDLEKDILVISVVHNFTNIVLSANTTSVTTGDFVEITLTVTNELGKPVDEATATFTAVEGTFVGGKDRIQVNTTSAGKATVVWNTTDVSPPIGGLSYLISVNLIKEGYNTNSSSISIFVSPPQYKLVTTTVATPATITQGQNVSFTVRVTANGQAVANASVQIVALDGKFASTGNAIAIKNTNDTGYATFIWITSEMKVSTAKNYTFTIHASLPGYTTSDTETILIQVNPQASQSTTSGGTTGGQGNNVYKNLGILLGVTAGVIALGALGYFLLRRKPVS